MDCLTLCTYCPYSGPVGKEGNHTGIETVDSGPPGISNAKYHAKWMDWPHQRNGGRGTLEAVSSREIARLGGWGGGGGRDCGAFHFLPLENLPPRGAGGGGA